MEIEEKNDCMVIIRVENGLRCVSGSGRQVGRSAGRQVGKNSMMCVGVDVHVHGDNDS